MSTYCTLAEAKGEIKAQGTVEDDQMLRLVRQVSSRVDGIMNPRTRRPYFEPYREQRAFPLSERSVDGWADTFYFKQPLLSISSVLADTTDVTADVEAYPILDRPIRALHFKDQARHWYDFASTDGSPVYIYITGLWGFHSDYANAWANYDTVAVAAVTPTGTTINVTNAVGDDPWGIAPRFSPGALLQIDGGTEILYTSAVTTNVLTVRRAVNGTTAPAGNYDIGDAVAVWQVEDSIKRVVARQAALLYARKGAFQVETVDGVGAISYPQDLLTELRVVLSEYQYW